MILSRGLFVFFIVPQRKKNTYKNKIINKNEYLLDYIIYNHNFINKKNDNINKNKTIYFQFYLLCIKYNNCLNNNVIDIAKFLMFVGHKHPSFEKYIQLDTHAFMTFLLENINIELNENTNDNEYKQIIYSNENFKKYCNEEFNEFFVRRQSSIISEFFYSLIITLT